MRLTEGAGCVRRDTDASERLLFETAGLDGCGRTGSVLDRVALRCALERICVLPDWRVTTPVLPLWLDGMTGSVRTTGAAGRCLTGDGRVVRFLLPARLLISPELPRVLRVTGPALRWTGRLLLGDRFEPADAPGTDDSLLPVTSRVEGDNCVADLTGSVRVFSGFLSERLRTSMPRLAFLLVVATDT